MTCRHHVTKVGISARSPAPKDALNADRSAKLAGHRHDELRATLLACAAGPPVQPRAFITQAVRPLWRGNTVLAEHADGGTLRIDPGHRGIDRRVRTPLLDLRWRNSRWPRRTTTSPSPAPPGRGDQLPELPGSRGPRRDVAVHAGRSPAVCGR